MLVIDFVIVSCAQVRWLVSMSMIHNYCHRWLCGVGRVLKGRVVLEVRRSNRSMSKLLEVPVETYYERVVQAYFVVSQFWLNQIRRGIQYEFFDPVDRNVMVEASWVLGLDLSKKGGAFCLRGLLGAVFGYDCSETDMLKQELPSLLASRSSS